MDKQIIEKMNLIEDKLCVGNSISDEEKHFYNDNYYDMIKYVIDQQDHWINHTNKIE